MSLQITLVNNELYSFLKMDPGFDDVTVNNMLTSAKTEAEMFLNTDFSTTTVNEDGSTTTTPNEAPAPVKEWVLNRTAQKYENIGAWVQPDFTSIQPYKIYSFRGI